MDFFGILLRKVSFQSFRFGQLSLHSFLIDKLHRDGRKCIGITEFDILFHLPPKINISIDLEVIHSISRPIVHKGDQLFIIEKVALFIFTDMMIHLLNGSSFHFDIFVHEL